MALSVLVYVWALHAPGVVCNWLSCCRERVVFLLAECQWVIVQQQAPLVNQAPTVGLCRLHMTRSLNLCLWKLNLMDWAEVNSRLTLCFRRDHAPACKVLGMAMNAQIWPSRLGVSKCRIKKQQERQHNEHAISTKTFVSLPKYELLNLRSAVRYSLWMLFRQSRIRYIISLGFHLAS